MLYRESAFHSQSAQNGCPLSKYHDWVQHLRWDGHRRQGRAGIEGTVRYDHQGGGQRQAGQGTVI